MRIPSKLLWLAALLPLAVSAPALAPAPAGLTATATGVSGQVRLSWAAVVNSPPVTGYQVYRATYPDLSAVAPSYVTLTSRLETGLPDAAPAYFAVASEESGTGPQSAGVSAIPYQGPDAPLAWSASPMGYGSRVLLQWQAPATYGYGLGAYRVENSAGAVLQTAAFQAVSTVVTVACGQALTVQLRAVDSAGHTGAASAPLAFTVPCPPLITAAGIQGQALRLTWSAAASQVLVRYGNLSTTADPLLVFESALAGTITSLTLASVPDFETRYYRLYNVDAAGNTSAGSNQRGLLAPPDNLRAAGKLGGAILQWSAPAAANSAGLTAYQVYYASSAAMLTASAGVTIVAGTALGVTLAGLADNTPYYFAVASQGGGRVGALGLTASATPRLPSPVITAFNQALGGSLGVHWTAVDAGVNTPTYTVHRALDTSLTGQVAVAAAQGLSATVAVSGLNSHYYWFVTATDTAGNYSNLTPSAAGLLYAPELSAPAPAVLAASESRVQLGWNAVLGADQYQVDRSVSGPGAAALNADRSWLTSATGFTDTTPVNGQDVTYKVLARKAVALASSQVESAQGVTVAVGSLAPGIPGRAYDPAGTAFSYLSAVAHPSSVASGVDLRWAASEPGTRSLLGYQVYRGYSVESLSPSAFTAANVTAYADSGAGFPDPYALVYGVEAVDVSGTASARLTGTATAYAPWPAPRSPTAFALGGGVRLAWAPPAGAGNEPFSSYAVYRRGQAGAPDQFLAAVTSAAYVDLAPAPAQGSQPSYGIAVRDSLGLEGAVTRVAAALQAAPFTNAVPSAPSGVLARTLSGTALPVLLQWRPNPENEAVSLYHLYRDAAYLGSSAGLAFTDTGAPGGSTVVYQVQAANAVGAGLSGSAAALVVAPPAPSSVSISMDVDGAGPPAPSLRLSWSDLGAPAGVSSYVVYRDSVQLADITATAWTDSGLTPGSTVTYAVAGSNGSISSTAAVSSTVTLALAPAAPSGFTALPGTGSVKLGWTGQPQAQQYWVYRATYALAAYPVLAERLLTLTAATAYTDLSPPAAPLLYYGVAALNYLGRGPAALASAAPAPGTPTALAAAPGYSGSPQVALSWTAPAPSASATSYTVYRASAADVTPGLLASVSGTTFVDAVPNTNAPYVYWVMAANASAGGTAGPTAALRAYLPPSSPQDVSATGAFREVDLRWRPAGSAQGVTGYAVAWSTLGFSGLSPAAGSSFAFPGLDEGQAVTLSLKALNSAGASAAVPASAYANAAGPPPPPQNFRALVGTFEAGSGSAGVILTWTPVGTGRSALLYKSSAPLTPDDAAGGAASAFYLATALGSASSLTDSAVSTGQPYYYALTSLGPEGLPGGESAAAFSQEARPFSYPSVAPLTATAGTGRVDLQWSAPAYGGTAGLAPVPYRLYRYQSTSRPVLGVNSPDPGFPLALTFTAYADTAVVNGLGYFYVVTVVDALGREQPVVPATGSSGLATLALTPRGPRRPPTGVQIFPGDKTVTLRWVAAKGYANEGLLYNVYRRKAGESFGSPLSSLYHVGPSSAAFLGSVSLVAQTLRDQSDSVGNILVNTTAYYYALTVVNEFGESGKSAELLAIPFRPLDPGLNDAANRQVTAVVTGKKDVNLRWGPCPDQPAAEGYAAAAYRVYRSLDGGSTYALKAEMAHNVTITAYGVTDTDTQFGASYVYRVVPVDVMGNEGLSYNLQTAVIPSSQNAVLLFRNSFNPATGETVAVQFTLLQPGHAWVKVFTLQGDYVVTLFDEEVAAAAPDSPYLSEKRLWDGRNADGQTVASGVYLVHLESAGYRANARVAVIK
jgi:fibronectin type 3 domain-containing protein